MYGLLPLFGIVKGRATEPITFSGLELRKVVVWKAEGSEGMRVALGEGGMMDGGGMIGPVQGREIDESLMT